VLLFGAAGTKNNHSAANIHQHNEASNVSHNFKTIIIKQAYD
jgi:hypothetical protein